MSEKHDGESAPTKIPHYRQVLDRAGVTPEVEKWEYDGSGTEEDPYIVTWIDHDPRNPMMYSTAKKWGLTMMVAVATLAVAFVSSAFSGGSNEVLMEFHCTEEVLTLGTSLFVLGFAVGPMIWAPLSELYGRQGIFSATYGMLTLFTAVSAASQNIQTIIVLRFFAGAFGSSPLTNAGGVIADMFTARDRGLALTAFASAPFMGPVIGPIVGGFVGETIGWRWLFGIMAIFTGTLWIIGTAVIPETYSPVLQRKRAEKLSKITGKVYKSRADAEQGPTTAAHVFKTSLSRPWVLLIKEPIVILLSIYLAIEYGTLYMLFSAYPIVYQEARGWSEGIGALPFLGVMVGMLGAITYSAIDNHYRYKPLSDKYKGFAPPETRLPPALVGGVACVVGLFWFAWTDTPDIQYMASIAGGAPFGFGMVLIFLSVFNYLIDGYTIFAASVLAANAILRSLFGFAFPLFTTYMYENLGLNWAASIPAFLSLLCVPLPFLFWKYGAKIREKCKYAAEAAEFMRKMQQQNEGDDDDDSQDQKDGSTSEESVDKSKENREEREDEEMQEAFDESYKPEEEQPRLEPIKSRASTRRPGMERKGTSYDDSPFDLDRTNTNTSFKGEKRPEGTSRRSSRASAAKP